MKSQQAPSKATQTRKTSLDLDADTVAKLRAIIRTMSKTYTVEQMLNEWMASLVADAPTECYIQESIICEEWSDWGTPERRSAIKAKIRRICDGDRRLVRPEPMPKNLYCPSRVMERLEKMAADKKRNPNNSSASHIARSLLDRETDELLVTGDWSLGITSAKGGAA